jgi:multiple sugar transport system permease protein
MGNPNHATVTALSMNSHDSYLRPSRGNLCLFLGPAALLLIFLLGIPILNSLWIAMHGGGTAPETSNGLSSGIFIGLDHFAALIHDANFLHSTFRLVLFSSITTALEVAIGLTVALYLGLVCRVPAFIQVALVLPMFVIPVVSGLTFRLLFDGTTGLLPQLSQWFQFSPPDIFGESFWAFTAIILQDIWRQWPFVFLIIFAGVQSMPREPIEAIRLDGANMIATLRYVILPSLRNTIAIAACLKVIESLRAFTEIFIMTGGGPGDSTSVLSLFIVKQLMTFGDFGYGSAAASYLLFIGVAIAIYVSRRLELPGINARGNR